MKVDITYQRIDINTLNLTSKPVAYNGINYPLRELEHRNFEILIYSLYNQEIINKRTAFDDIMLMGGIRDKAQDCAFFNQGIKTGIIQCKHSENDTKQGMALCVKEIIKFILYSIADDSLVPYLNSFTYYFASSSGFDMKTDEYLRIFNAKIVKEKRLEKWTSDVIKNSKNLNHFKYEEIKEELLRRLTILHIIPIIPTDIQSLLTINEATVVPTFFSVRIVVDNESISDLKTTIDEIKEYATPKTIKPEKIIDEFKEESIFLANYKSTFSLNSPLIIERKITVKITDWIKTALKEKEENIAIIKGGAGSGKSVILNNLYHSLTTDGIPTIAIKADIKSADTIAGLEKKLNISTSLETSIKTLLNTYEKVVVIIDQIDALSQTLSANRNNLTTYISLVEKLKKIPGARVVISVREYDLNYDPYLIPFKKNIFFETGYLEDAEVVEVLKALQVNNYSVGLIKLLTTPLHLELFCQVYSNQEKNIKFYSIYDLYTELWLLKIAKKGTRNLREELKKTLYAIASKIYERQGNLSVSKQQFETDDVEYLITEGLLNKINNSKELTFFHQTFYDYVFARQFVEGGQSVIDYLNDNNQGLFIRSCLKIILSHLRDQNPKYYKHLIVELLTSSKIRFHIKQLVLNYLGSIEDPGDIEKEIVQANIIGQKDEEVFYESLNTSNWVKYFIETGWINSYLDSNDEEKINIAFQMLLRNKDNAFNTILDHLSSTEINNKHDDIIARFLYFANNWNDTAKNLYYRTKESIMKSAYYICHCMELALNYDENWVYSEFGALLKERAEALDEHSNKFPIDHSETELMKKLYKNHFEKAFELSEDIIRNIIIKTEIKSNYGGLSEDWAFLLFSSTPENHYGDDDEFYQIFINAVEESARNNSLIFKEFTNKYSQSNFTSILRIIIFGYLANPKLYYEEALDTLKYIHYRNGFRYNDKLGYFLRKLITTIYPLLSLNQKEDLNTLLLSIKDKHELELYIHPVTKKKTQFKYFGYLQYQFLTAVPESEIKEFPELNKKHLELNRRFGKIKDKEPNVLSVTGVPAPYKNDNYLRMTLKDWEKTFYKYNDTWQYNRIPNAGGLLQHARVFEEQVAKRADFFWPLLQKIINNDKISDDYKSYGINGLIKANYNYKNIEELIVKQISNKLSDSNILHTIWSIDHLIKNGGINKVIFNFLCKQALFNNDPTKDDLSNPRQRSINSVRGAAFDRLLRLEDKGFANKIFSITNKAIKSEKTFAVKATIISNSAYLLNIDRDKAFKVFVRLIKSDKRLLNEAMWPAGYFSNFYFLKMTFFFEMAMKEKKVFKSLGNLFGLAWLRGIEQSKNYLFELLKKSNEAGAEIIKIAVHPQNLINEDGSLNAKCMQIFEYLFNKEDKEIIHQYSIAFLHFKPEMFEGLFPILKSYAKSKAFRNSPAYFCKYLIASCNKLTVLKCAELISNFDRLEKTNITEGNYYDSEPLNAVIAVYNVLGNTPKDKELKNYCMDIFDKMLQQAQHRNAAQKITTLVEF